jgi:AraC-like DNA-binding protein
MATIPESTLREPIARMEEERAIRNEGHAVPSDEIPRGAASARSISARPARDNPDGVCHGNGVPRGLVCREPGRDRSAGGEDRPRTNRISAVWVDMRLRKLPCVLQQQLARACRLVVTCSANDLRPELRAAEAEVIAFDFDYPDARSLQALLSAKRQFAHIPILMLVEQPYDNLLLWALRARVWDVLIKPVACEQVLERMEWSRAARAAIGPDRMRINAMPVPATPMEARFLPTSAGSRCTDTACGYINDHMHEKLSVMALARRSGMNRYQFSRIFRSEHGMTFRDYVLSVRLHRAEEMLSHTDAPVTEIAFCAGFHDLSHFARLFRRRTGCSPREFRQRQRIASCSSEAQELRACAQDS